VLHANLELDLPLANKKNMQSHETSIIVGYKMQEKTIKRDKNRNVNH
jgi:hypothetical protein